MQHFHKDEGEKRWEVQKIARISGHLPESTFCPHAEVLQDEPYSDLILGIGEFERTDTKTADQIPGEHAS